MHARCGREGGGVVPARAKTGGVVADDADARRAQPLGHPFRGCQGIGAEIGAARRPADRRRRDRFCTEYRREAASGVRRCRVDVQVAQVVSTAQRERGQVDAAQRVQPEPGSGAGFGEAPEGDWGGRGRGQRLDECRVGEAGLEHEQAVEVGAFQLGYRVVEVGRLEEELAYADGRGFFQLVDDRESRSGGLLGEPDVERGPCDRSNAEPHVPSSPNPG